MSQPASSAKQRHDISTTSVVFDTYAWKTRSHSDHDTLRIIDPGARHTWAFLERISKRNIQNVDVSYSSRVFRHGFELIQQLCGFHDKKIVVYHCPHAERSEQELPEGFLAVCNFFVASNGGKRGTKKLQIRKSEKYQTGSVPGVEGATEKMDGYGEVGVQPMPRLLQEG